MITVADLKKDVAECNGRRSLGEGYANLSDANLSYADLRGANLRGANLPSPTVVLLALWRELSDLLTRDLMRFDAACHPDSRAFQRWAAGGACPYDRVKVQRAANFRERADLWSPGTPQGAHRLMCRVLAEKTKGWEE